MSKNKCNIEAKSKLVSGIIRIIPAFLIGGPTGLIANGVYTALNIKKEVDDEKKRQQKRHNMLSNNQLKRYCPNEQETEMMIRDYNEKFKSLKLTKIQCFKLFKTERYYSSSNNWIIPCTFCFQNDNNENKGVILCTYDFWNEFYKHSEGDIKKFRVRSGKEYICFSPNGTDFYFGGYI